jgi:hypothetical protein
MGAMTTAKLQQTKEVKELRESEKKWGKEVLAPGWTLIPNILLIKQHALGLDPVDINILLQILKHWWRADEAPFPSQVNAGADACVAPHATTFRANREPFDSSLHLRGRDWVNTLQLRWRLHTTPLPQARSSRRRTSNQLGADPSLAACSRGFLAFSCMSLGGDGRRAQGDRIAAGEVIGEVVPQTIEQNAA